MIGIPLVYSQIAIPASESNYTAPDSTEQMSKTPYEKIIQIQVYDEETKQNITISKNVKEYKILPDGNKTIIMLDEKVSDKTITRKEALEKTRWGIGCPHRCGRFWLFKPMGNTWTPADPLYENYLTDYQNLDGIISFTCDRCGEVVSIDTK